jgi:hypothetical protein
VVQLNIGQITIQIDGFGSVDVIVDVNGYYGSPNGDPTNVFLGTNAGNPTMRGAFNTGIGNSALFRNTDGSYNTAVGFDALSHNVNGTYNTAVGQEALLSNTAGSYNTGLGYQALNQNNAVFNTAVGFGALFNSTIGFGNIAVGADAGSRLTTGSYNIYIGNLGVVDDEGTIRIGREVFQHLTYIAGIIGTGVTGVPVLVSDSGQLGVASSSQCVKENIREVGHESDGLMNLRPVAFRYKPEIDPTGLTQYGLIAEEVAEVYPDLVGADRDGKPQTVRYHLVNALLLNEVQKQHRTIETQKGQIKDLEARLAALEARVQDDETTNRR